MDIKLTQKGSLRLKIGSILCVFGVIFCLISIANHINFRTYALDLGLYTHALYQYAHFDMADSTMIKVFSESMLGGHFDLYLLIFSPFVYLFGTYTLLVIQISFVLIGGLGVYQVMKSKYPNNKRISIVAMMFFYSFYGVFGALSFDYHSVVVSSSMIPWMILFLDKEKWRHLTIVTLFILAGQENTSLFLGFVFLGLMIQYWSSRRKRYVAMLCAFLSFNYFIVVLELLIPYFSKESAYTGFSYSVLGDTPKEFVYTFLSDPIGSLKWLYASPTSSFDVLKGETWMLLFCSGIVCLVFKSSYLLMLIPIFLQKFYHDHSMMWSICGQYNVEFAPILAIGVFDVIGRIRHVKIREVISVIALLSCMGATIRLMDHTEVWSDKSKIRFYQSRHYTKDYNTEPVHQFLSEVPDDIAVSAQSPYVPHVCLRQKIYQFPLIHDAEMIILSIYENPYPISYEEFYSEIDRLTDSEEWSIVNVCEELIVFKRKEK